MKIILFILISILALTEIFPAPGVVKPQNTKEKISIKESGKNRVYYPIQQNDPSIIIIKGPCKLTARTRVQFSKNENSASYTVTYNIDGGGNNDVNFKDIKASKKIKFDNPDYQIATGKDIIIDLGPGEHTLNFRRKDSNPPVIARYSFSRLKEKKLNWVMLSPTPANEPVDLVTHEAAIHYYRFSEKKPLKIKIIGPTLVRVLTRFENQFTMKGNINYRLQLKEDGKILHTYLFTSSVSDITTYKDNDKFMPGKAKEFYIEVPRGKHTYTISLMDKDKKTILARVLFPKKDVKLEE